MKSCALQIFKPNFTDGYGKNLSVDVEMTCHIYEKISEISLLDREIKVIIYLTVKLECGALEITLFEEYIIRQVSRHQFFKKPRK